MPRRGWNASLAARARWERFWEARRRELLREAESLPIPGLGPGESYIVEWDIPMGAKQGFYKAMRGVFKALGVEGYLDELTSTRSVLVTVDRELAALALLTARRFGRANLYVGRRVEV